MEQEKCKKCGCIRLAHTGEKGQTTIGFGMAVHLDEGYCISCVLKENPCFGWVEK